MVDKDQTDEEATPAPVAPAPRRGPGHRGADMRDTVAEMAERAQLISQEAGSKVSLAMKDVISAAAGLAGFAIESARDLVQYMIRRGQMTQEEGDKLIREAEQAHGLRPSSEKGRPTASKIAADKAVADRAARDAATRPPLFYRHRSVQVHSHSALAALARLGRPRLLPRLMSRQRPPSPRHRRQRLQPRRRPPSRLRRRNQPPSLPPSLPPSRQRRWPRSGKGVPRHSQRRQRSRPPSRPPRALCPSRRRRAPSPRRPVPRQLPRLARREARRR